MSPLAIWSLVLGVAGFFFFYASAGGIVCGLLALVKIPRSRGRLSGRATAAAGLVISIVAAIVFISFPSYRAAARKLTKSDSTSKTLVEARQGFATALTRKERTGGPVMPPPSNLFTLRSYRSPAGELAAYLSVVPNDGKKHPAIVWLTGGFSNSIGANAWHPAEEENDQSARFFREAGVITLYPSLRGGNKNPGYHETFFGEVDDVLAATDFLATQPGIDADRIYLGGHSTGGTLALLVAESSPRFRAVFAFGPVGRVTDYGTDVLTFDPKRAWEVDLRSPGKWMHSILTPTYVFEGESDPSNISSVLGMKRSCFNDRVKFYPVPGKNHFSILAPYSRLIARQIVQDTGPTVKFQF